MRGAARGARAKIRRFTVESHVRCTHDAAESPGWRRWQSFGVDRSPQSLLGRDPRNAAIVCVLGNALEQLRFKRETNRRRARIRAQSREKRVVEALSTSEACAARIEGATGHDDRIKISRENTVHRARFWIGCADAVAIKLPEFGGKRISGIDREKSECAHRIMSPRRIFLGVRR